MVNKTVMITGADRGVGAALCRQFLDGGWQVYAGQYLPHWNELEAMKEIYPQQLHILPLDVSDATSVNEAADSLQESGTVIDMLINCAGITLPDEPEKIKKIFRVNSLGPVNMVEKFLPLMQQGEKRLCFVSSEAGSISLAHRVGAIGYCMSKAALNMSIRLMFNRLQPQGYSFRIYHPGWVRSYMLGEFKNTDGKLEPEETAKVAYEQFTSDREQENVLYMMDVYGDMWPF